MILFLALVLLNDCNYISDKYFSATVSNINEFSAAITNYKVSNQTYGEILSKIAF